MTHDLPLPVLQCARALLDGVRPERMGRELGVSQWQAQRLLEALYGALGVRGAVGAVWVLIRMGGV